MDRSLATQAQIGKLFDHSNAPTLVLNEHYDLVVYQLYERETYIGQDKRSS